jgi:hypothetical protein
MQTSFTSLDRDEIMFTTLYTLIWKSSFAETSSEELLVICVGARSSIQTVHKLGSDGDLDPLRDRLASMHDTPLLENEATTRTRRDVKGRPFERLKVFAGV